MKLILPLFLLACLSCNSQDKLNTHIKIEKYINKNFDTYREVRELIFSELNHHQSEHTSDFQELIFTDNYNVDELVLINATNDKLVGIVTIPSTIEKNSTHDWIFMIYGVKLDSKWHVLRGGSLFVPREYYRYDINTPLSFEELGIVGRDFFLKRYLDFESEVPIINSEAINKFVSFDKYFKFKKTDPKEKWYEFIEYRNTKKMPLEEVADIKESIKSEVHQDAIIPEKGTKEFRELYGDKPPLFEQEEWKAILKK